MALFALQQTSANQHKALLWCQKLELLKKKSILFRFETLGKACSSTKRCRGPGIDCVDLRWRHTALTHTSRSLTILSHLICAEQLIPLCQGEHSCGARSDDVIPGDDITPVRTSGCKCKTGEVSLVLLFSPKIQHRTVHIKERALNCPCPRCLTQKLIYAYFNHEPLHVSQLSLFKLNVTYSLTLHPFILTVWSHTTMWATVMLTESQFLVIGIDQQFGMPQSSSHFVINFLYQVFQLSKCILTNWSMKSVRFHFMTLI